MAVGGAVGEAAGKAMLPVAIGLGAATIGWYIGSRGKEREREARAQAEGVAATQTARADEAVRGKQEALSERNQLDEQLER